MKRCAHCHEYFEPTSSSDPHHCSKCMEKMRKCKNCHSSYIPDDNTGLCPICYINLVRTCRICKKEFIPRFKSHHTCPKCYNKLKHPKKTTKNLNKREKKSPDKTVELLIKALDEPKTRDYAKEKLIELKEISINILISSLNCEPKWKRRELVSILVEMDDFAVEHLIKSLNNEDYLIRKNCVKALGLIGDVRAVEYIILTLNDDDSFVRRTSAKALGRIGDERALNPLVEATEDSNSSVRITAVKSIGYIGNETVIDDLIELLDDDDPNLVILVLKSLYEIDEEVGFKYMIENVHNSNSKINGYCKNFIIRLKGEEYLFDILNEDDDDVELLNKERFLELIEDLSSEDPNIKLEAVKSLGNAKDPRSVKYLIEALDYEDPKVKLEIVKSLGKIKNLDSLELLIRTLNDEDIAICWAAEEAIANYGPEAIPIISKSIDTEDDNLRYYLVSILGEIEDMDSEQLLIQFLNDPDLDVKLKTIESLSRIGTSYSVKSLIDLLNDENRKVAKSIAYALKRICKEEDLFILEYKFKNDYLGENKILEELIQKIKVKLEKEEKIKSETETPKEINVPDKDIEKPDDKDLEDSKIESYADKDDLFDILDSLDKFKD